MASAARRLTLSALLIAAAAVFTLGIDWGLPSRIDDHFLVGRNPGAWHLESLMAHLPEVDATRGADVVVPSGDAGAIVQLNQTDEQRARILVRYRLYSEQPDEMITFRSLSQMKPRAGDFDPRLYQYGGLWIYGTGAIIEAANLLGLLQITSRDNYIGNPQLFGKFYIAARLYSAAFGVIGVWAVFVLVGRLIPGKIIPAAAGAICFFTMPVVVNTAHEAKPHLAGAVLILLAILTADNYLKSGKPHWMWITGLLCGAAAGMVLWAAIALLLIPFTAFLHRRRPLISCAAMLATAIAVYALTNPYVIFHLLHNPAVLRSNLGNTAAMYHVGNPAQELFHALALINAGTTPAIFAIGIVALIAFLKRPTRDSQFLLAALTLVMIVLFIATAAGKPGEYGRFAILPDTALAIFAISGLARLRIGSPAALLLAALTAVYGFFYLTSFTSDAWHPDSTTRRVVAADLQNLLDEKRAAPLDRLPRLGLFADPAPYNLPPVNLYDWKILRLPKGSTDADCIVRPVENLSWWDPRDTPISWASKQFEVIQPNAK